MSVKCEVLAKADGVISELSFRTISSWNTLIARYVHRGQCNESFSCFDQMQSVGLSPNAVTYTCALKACGKRGDIHRGKQIHVIILNRSLLDKDIILGNALVDMYAKCSMITLAQKAFKELPVRDTVSFSALLAGYTQQGQGSEAFSCFERMEMEGIHPDAVTFLCILKACSSMGNIDKGKQIHNKILCTGSLEKDIVLGTALINMYAKCSAVAKAQHVLEKLPVRDVISWNALISGYAEQGRCYDAWNCFERMKREGLSPDAVTFICLLKACGSKGAIDKGEHVHHEVLRTGLLEKDTVLGNALIDMYAKCGMLERALQVLENLPVQDVVSWNVLITGYGDQQRYHESLDCFRKMKSENLYPNVVTFVSVVKACGNIGSTDVGKQIHEEILSRGLLEKSIILGNALVDMYVKFRMLTKAYEVLEVLPVHDATSWNTLIAGYVQEEQCNRVFECFERMRNEGVSPDPVTRVCITKACSIARDIVKGKQIHHDIADMDLLEKDVTLGNALVDMYAKCGELKRARQMCEELPVQDTVSWNALIAGHVQRGRCRSALKLFEQMVSEGFSPSTITYVCVLKACSIMGQIDMGKQVHGEISMRGLLDRDVMLGNAVVDMYAKCGMFVKAEQVLEGLPGRDLVPWNALIAGCAQLGRCNEASHYFERMQSNGIAPDAITFVCMLKACGSVGAIERGKRIHDEISSRGSSLEEDVVLGISLVDMYAKCGVLARARQVLDKLPVRGVVAWNALIAGHVKGGQGSEAVSCLEQMQSEGVSPDEVTVLCVLSACCHGGMIEEARRVYQEMMQRHGMVPSEEQVTSMVTVLGNAGMLEEAMSVTEMMMPWRRRRMREEKGEEWVAMLAAARKWGKEVVARAAFEKVVGGNGGGWGGS